METWGWGTGERLRLHFVKLIAMIESHLDGKGVSASMQKAHEPELHTAVQTPIVYVCLCVCVLEEFQEVARSCGDQVG